MVPMCPLYRDSITFHQNHSLKKLSFFSGWSMDQGAVSGGSWLGQEDQLSDGRPGHGAGLPHANHPLQARRGKAKEHERLVFIVFTCRVRNYQKVGGYHRKQHLIYICCLN